MPAGYQDIYLEKGTDFSTDVTLYDSDNTPYDLSNFKVKAQARTSYFTANTTINFTSSIIDANNGIIRLSASSANTANLKMSKLVYDVLIKNDSSNNISRVLEGVVFISPAATSSSNTDWV